MMVLVIGPNGSGKSLYAERLAKSICTGRLYYVATLRPFGEEGAARVEKHRLQRANMGFITIESSDAQVKTNRQDTVLLEDISNLVANLMFEHGDQNPAETARKRVMSLRDACKNLVCVSISGLEASDGDDMETKTYIKELQEVNDMLWERADAVVELLSGTATIRKGSLSWG